MNLVTPHGIIIRVDGRGVRASDPIGSTHLVSPRNSGPRRDRCVVEVACPQCKAEIGVLCTNGNGPKWDTHYLRRYLARRRRGAKLRRHEAYALGDLQ